MRYFIAFLVSFFLTFPLRISKVDEIVVMLIWTMVFFGTLHIYDGLTKSDK